MTINLPAEVKDRKVIIFVTGLSGAGISSTMKILEDMGYSAFDNLPLSLVSSLLEQEHDATSHIAISIDTRSPHFDPMHLMETVRELSAQDLYTIKTVFLVADDAILLKRFNETRRTHPLAKDRPVVDGIAAEKALLFPLKHEAGYVVDTSEYSIHDLRRVIDGFGGGLKHKKLNISLMSFSYRYGLPREADLVLDVRFLHNPNWVTSLKDKTGLEETVQTYVKEDAAYEAFILSIRAMLETVLPRYLAEGKSYLTIAFGCTGGKHRSVTVCEDIANYLRNKNLPVHIHHREIKAS
ncbi:MAG: RNase adapter RapZ [Pseudobdellovibrionaceae bacterium]|jgi:UPF0042 nucleotide-binding protein|nr:RNase adapter RapZ [Pseudobdellovibrionaceae bacterium]